LFPADVGTNFFQRRWNKSERGQSLRNQGTPMKLLIGYVGIVGTALFLMIWGVSLVMTEATENEQRDLARSRAAQSVQDRVNTDSLQRKRKEAMDRAIAQAAAEKNSPQPQVASATDVPPQTAVEIAAPAATSRVAVTTAPASSSPSPSTSEAATETTATASTAMEVATASDTKAGPQTAASEIAPASAQQSPSKKTTKSRRVAAHDTRGSHAGRRARHAEPRDFFDNRDDFEWGEARDVRRTYRSYREYRAPFAEPFGRVVRRSENPFFGDF
jgi:hypothetical protein